jgi:hypothetical protein
LTGCIWGEGAAAAASLHQARRLDGVVLPDIGGAIYLLLGNGTAQLRRRRAVGLDN